jgi:hypothetical protein
VSIDSNDLLAFSGAPGAHADPEGLMCARTDAGRRFRSPIRSRIGIADRDWKDEIVTRFIDMLVEIGQAQAA